MCARKHFVPINRKVTGIILVTLAIGIGALVLYFASALTETIETSTEENLEEQSQILYTAVENFMLPGQAPIAVRYFREIEAQETLSTVDLFRADGTEAFTDNSTIEAVNDRLESSRFSIEERDRLEPQTRGGENFRVAAEMPPFTSVFRETEESGKTFFGMYKPLINKPKCTRCHGSNHTIRGVLELRTDITDSVVRRRNTILVSGAVFLLGIIVLSVALTRFMHAAVLQPVKTVGDVCTAVTKGDFTKRVSFRKNDEIGELGTTVNTMVEGLYERYELSKYVSSSTIESLRESGGGRDEELTLLLSDIRGFTSYSEKNSASKVVSHLNTLLNRQSEIIIENGGDIDKYVGDEIVAFFTGKDGAKAACRSAMEIQDELTGRSREFDGLSVGIGINHGQVILGMIGSQRRADYTVIGDNVNIASRLCSAAKAGEIIVSDSTHALVKGMFRFEGPYKTKVKGKDRYIRVYKLPTGQ